MNFNDILKKYKKIIYRELEVFLNKEITKIKNPFLKLNYSFIKEFVLNGGKRLRPIALIMAYNAVNGKNEELIYIPSLAVELLHNSTLVHDDIMDEDDLRRGKLTIHKNLKDWFLNNNKEINNQSKLFNNISSRFAVSNAILCGDILLSLGYDALTECEPKKLKEVLRVYSDSYKTVANGQILDIMSGFSNLTEEEYFEIVRKKTANLFKASVEIGAILGNASDEQIKNLSSYALETAIAFQIRDDIMDIGKEMSKGHELGSDIKKGKKTLIIIKALELANEKEKNIIKSILGKENASSQEIDSVIDILKSTGAIDYCEKISREKIKIAKEYLKKAEISKESFEFFDKLADFMVERKV